MFCKKCKREIPDGATFCPWCGKKQTTTTAKVSRRGNGQGSVYREGSNNTWTAARTWGYEFSGKVGHMIPIRTRKYGFATKRDALEALAKMEPPASKLHNIDAGASLSAVYDLWLADYQRRGRSQSTENCYKAAFKYFAPLHSVPIADIGIDDLQECIDDCPYGRRTRENMKATAGLIYKYAIPRGYFQQPVNLAEYLFVGGAPGDTREAFTPEEVEIVRQHIGAVPYADYIYCQIYLGFRPHEFLTLDASRYDRENRCIIGGGKTDAGTDRTVTISPKIQPIVDRLVSSRTAGPIFCAPDGRTLRDSKYREDCFYPALKSMGLPLLAADGSKRKLTPHCCRHTFATLIKNIDAPDKDKLELMGHTSTEMLRHYQHVNVSDLQRITDRL